MFYTYGISCRGSDHIRNDVVCQDYHRIVKCNDHMVIAAVADGLGSEKYTDIASKVATYVSTMYCSKKLQNGMSSDEILDVIERSFRLSQKAIELVAEKSGNDIDEYDTTLSLAIIKDDTLYYGHSGDSGILAMTTDGLFCQVTEQQRDEMGRVFPLIYSDHWVFGKYDKPVQSVLLATDGMFEIFFPIYIREAPVNVHVALAGFFMDREKLLFEEKGELRVRDEMKRFIEEIDRTQVSDDKTVVVVVNDSVQITRQPDEYYIEPDWDELKKKHNDAWRKIAYPTLFDGITESPDNPVFGKEERDDNNTSGSERGSISINEEIYNEELGKSDI